MTYRPHLSCLAGLIVLVSAAGPLATEFKIDVVPTVIGPSEVEVEIRSNIPGTIEVMLGLGLAGQDPKDVFIGASKRIRIKNGRATATVSKPDLPGGKYEVEVSFYPRWGPQDSVAKGAGAKSEIHAGQPHIKLPSYQYLIAIVIIKCCSNTLLSDTALRALTFQQIQRHMSNHA